MVKKEGKHGKESLMEAFRMIFLLYTGPTPLVSTVSFFVYVIVSWRYGTNGYWQLQLTEDGSVTVKQSSIFPNICTFKTKIKLKHFLSSRMIPKHPKWQIFIHVNKDLFTMRL